MFRIIFAAAAVLAVVGDVAHAEDKKCNLFSAGSSTMSYEQIGTEACAKLCEESDGCVAWVYTPHNFNPKKAPGECRMLPDVSEEEASTTTFCNRL